MASAVLQLVLLLVIFVCHSLLPVYFDCLSFWTSEVVRLPWHKCQHRPRMCLFVATEESSQRWRNLLLCYTRGDVDADACLPVCLGELPGMARPHLHYHNLPTGDPGGPPPPSWLLIRSVA